MSHIGIWFSELPMRFHRRRLKGHLYHEYAYGSGAIRVSRVRVESNNEAVKRAALYFQEILVDEFPDLELCEECKMAFAIGHESPEDHDLHRDSGSRGLNDYIRALELQRKSDPAYEAPRPSIFGYTGETDPFI